MQKRKNLQEEIKDFQKDKTKLLLILLFLGLLGLFFPIIPGLVLLFFGFLLIFPQQGEEVILKIRKYFKLQS